MLPWCRSASTKVCTGTWCYWGKYRGSALRPEQYLLGSVHVARLNQRHPFYRYPLGGQESTSIWGVLEVRACRQSRTFSDSWLLQKEDSLPNAVPTPSGAAFFP